MKQTLGDYWRKCDNEELATMEVEDNVCYITANNKRKVGKIIFNFADDFNVYLNEGNHTNEVSMMTE